MSEVPQPAPTQPPAPVVSERVYVVDRIEGGVVVLVPEDDAFPDEEVSADDLGPAVSEGDVVRATVSEGVLGWRDAVLDPLLKAERLKRAEDRLRRLRKRDPGGDIVL